MLSKTVWSLVFRLFMSKEASFLDFLRLELQLFHQKNRFFNKSEVKNGEK